MSLSNEYCQNCQKSVLAEEHLYINGNLDIMKGTLLKHREIVCCVCHSTIRIEVINDNES